MWSSVLLLVGSCTLAKSNIILPTTGPQPAPHCSIIPNILNELNSPQFAVICRLPGGFDAPLSDYLNQTANEICDGDCRCVHGASARGGRCGVPVGHTKAFCICDYSMDPPIPSVFNSQTCLAPAGMYITALCPNSLLLGGFSSNACDHDCQCSHGYGNSHNHLCTPDNGDPTNTMTFCVCGGGSTLVAAS